LRSHPSDQYESCSKCPNLPRAKISNFSEAFGIYFGLIFFLR
jgi:hypothetical protein